MVRTRQTQPGLEPEDDGSTEVEDLPNLEFSDIELDEPPIRRRKPKEDRAESTISRGLGVGAMDATELESFASGDLSIAQDPAEIDLADFADLPDTRVSSVDEVDDDDSDIESGLPPLRRSDDEA